MIKSKDNFVHLHLHSTHSYTDGYGTAEQYIKRCKEIGQPAIGITDHGNISNHYKWYKECIKNDIIPILGCELYIAPNNELDEKNYYHITVLVKNNTGYLNLLKILTQAWQTNFKRKPLVKMEWLIENQEGLIITSGCISSKIDILIRNKKIEEAKNELLYLKNSIEHFYIEVSPLKFEAANGIIEQLYNFSNELNIPLVATMDCHYVHENETLIQQILLCIQSNDQMDNPKRWKFDQNDFYLKNREEMKESFKQIHPNLDFTEAFDNTIKIAEMIDFEFPKATPLKFPIPNEKKKYKFYEMCKQGMVNRKLSGEEYEERMEYEYNLIVKKEFIDYFLIVQDLVCWAKDNGILVGPARGSSAGSLICYLLRITEVDPLKWGLIFERFIDINREDLPDIDIDFEDERRPDIKRYLENKYGIDKVSAIATFATFKGKNTIQDFGRIYKIPFDIINKLKSVIIERSGGDSRASFTIQDTFEQFDIAKKALKEYPVLKETTKLEGQLRNMSSHASGIIISNEPLTNFCAIYKKKEENVASIDYYDASALGLVKLDILGLNTLTCINKALKYIKERTGKIIDIYNLPLDDQKVYDGFNNPKKLFGIFQFDGQSVNQVCRQINPRNFEELSAINALSRPGPMHGLDTEYNQPITTIYISRKNGKLPLKFVHPLLEPITKETQGVVIYQEQVMKTMREIGKMSWKNTAEIRKLISRSVGVEKFNTFKEKFVIGAKENGLTDKEIDNIWSAICTFGSWAFNKSHSISYSIISYWTMWLKIYYPIEYYAAMCSTLLQEDKIKKIIKEYLREEFKLLPLDINKSKESFIIDNNNLRLGFQQLKGIGENCANLIVKNQPYNNIDDFKIKTKLGKSKIELLNKFGAFNSIGSANKEMATLFGIVKSNEYATVLTFEERIKLCPLSVDFNILNEWKDFISKHIKFPIVPIEKLDSSINSQIVMGIVYDKNLKDKIEEALTRGKVAPEIKDGQSKYCNFVLEDDSDFCTIRISTRNFPKFKKLIFEEISESDIIMIKGKMGDGIRMMFANNIICLNHLKRKIENNESLTEDELIMTGKLLEYRPKYIY